MTAIPATVFNNGDVRLRVWFNDGVNSSQLLSHDQRLAASGSAMIAANVSNNAITTAKIADGAVTGPKFAAPFTLSGATGPGGTLLTGTNTASNGTGLAGVSTSGRGSLARRPREILPSRASGGRRPPSAEPEW